MRSFKLFQEEKPGLYANIHAKRARIKAGSGEKMRKPGSEGAPTPQDWKDASKTAKEEVELGEEQMYYSIVHKPTNKVLSTHKSLESAKDEHRGMDQGIRAHYYIATSKKEPKTFNMKEEAELNEEENEHWMEKQSDGTHKVYYKTSGGETKHIGTITPPRKGTENRYEAKHVSGSRMTPSSDINALAKSLAKHHRLNFYEHVEQVNEELHRVQVTVSDPLHTMVTMRGKKMQKFVRVKSDSKDEAIERAKKHFKNKSYLVHGAEHVGMVNEETEMNEAVSVKKQNYSWGKMMTVHHGNETSYPLHPEHQVKIKALGDGEKTSFKDETKRTVTAHRDGDIIHLSGAGTSKKTSVKRSHFTESYYKDKEIDRQGDERLANQTPFTPDKPKKNTGVKAGKYGSAYSRVRHLARMALKNKSGMKEEVKLDEASSAERKERKEAINNVHKGFYDKASKSKLKKVSKIGSDTYFVKSRSIYDPHESHFKTASGKYGSTMHSSEGGVPSHEEIHKDIKDHNPHLSKDEIKSAADVVHAHMSKHRLGEEVEIHESHEEEASRHEELARKYHRRATALHSSSDGNPDHPDYEHYESHMNAVKKHGHAASAHKLAGETGKPEHIAAAEKASKEADHAKPSTPDDGDNAWMREEVKLDEGKYGSFRVRMTSGTFGGPKLPRRGYGHVPGQNIDPRTGGPLGFSPAPKKDEPEKKKDVKPVGEAKVRMPKETGFEKSFRKITGKSFLQHVKDRNKEMDDVQKNLERQRQEYIKQGIIKEEEIEEDIMLPNPKSLIGKAAMGALGVAVHAGLFLHHHFPEKRKKPPLEHNMDKAYNENNHKLYHSLKSHWHSTMAANHRDAAKKLENRSDSYYQRNQKSGAKTGEMKPSTKSGIEAHERSATAHEKAAVKYHELSKSGAKIQKD